MSTKLKYNELSLRRLEFSDAEMIFEWKNHPTTRQAMFTSDAVAWDDHVQWLARTIADPACAYFIFEIAGSPSGIVGFPNINKRDLHSHWTFHLKPGLVPAGAGSAMGFLAIDYMFSVFGLHKVIGEVLADNKKSCKMHLRLGFRPQGVQAAHIRKGEMWSDVHVYEILAGEWKEKRELILSTVFADNGAASPLRILFTGGGGSASQSLQEQWSERYQLFFADANPDAFPPSIPEDRRCVIPFARDPNFLGQLKQVCNQHRIDVLVPGVDEELPLVAAMHDVSGWPRIMLPSANFVESMLDKAASAEAIKRAGLDVPVTLPLVQAEAIRFPLIAKPRSGRGSRGVMKLDSLKQVLAYIDLHGGEPHDYIAQELIPGQEFTVFVAANGGEVPKAVIPVRAIEKRGITIRAVVDPVPEVINYARAFQAHFRASGCYNIQCMLTQNGRVLPFEVNPRISTTFVLAIATGFDPIPMVLGIDDDAGNECFEPEPNWSLQRSWFTNIKRIF